MAQEKSLMRHTTAWLPLVMSLAALLFIVGYVAFVGIPAQPAKDEGAPARFFQLIMLTQAGIIGYFAVKWLPKKPKDALFVLVLQIAAALVPIATIFFLEM